MTTVAPELACGLKACPFPGEATCLEGFTDFAECPNTFEDEDESESADAADGSSDTGADEAAGDSIKDEPVQSDNGEVAVLGAESLSLAEAEVLMGEHECSVTLIAGDVKSGKTTLVLELYARFLEGPYEGWMFAGSRTLRALDIRHYPAQQASGAAEPTTARTPDDEMRLLHLALAKPTDCQHMLFSDVRGEFFDDLIDGAPVRENVRIAERADRCIITVDGERLADIRRAANAFLRARILLGALCADGGLDPTTPVAIVCTKWDKVPADRHAKVLAQAEDVAVVGREAGRVVTVQALSVRPGSAESPIHGLSDLLTWLTSQTADAIPPPPDPSPPRGRQFWSESDLS